MLLYIIRHGDPIYEPDSLTEKGKLQAQALARRLAVHGLDRIYASPLLRAQQTARPTCERLHKEPVILPWTSEQAAWDDLAFTDESGRTDWSFHVQSTRYKTAELLALGERWYKAEPFSLAPNAKGGYERIQKASDAFTESLGYRREGMVYRAVAPSEERVAVFCHQGFGTTWLSHLLAIPPVLFWSSFDLNHSSVTILHFQNHPDGLTAPICLCVSDISHIYADRLPLQFCNRLDL